MTSTFLRLRGIWNIAWNRSVQPEEHGILGLLASIKASLHFTGTVQVIKTNN